MTERVYDLASAREEAFMQLPLPLEFLNDKTTHPRRATGGTPHDAA